jgi:signal transduction histidine kinase
VLNLLSNAKDAISERRSKTGTDFEGIINIDTSVSDKQVFVRVTDNGGGVPEDALSRVFEPYFTTKGGNGGTGIGLYMSRMIIQNHNNGNLALKNVKDGACFEITISL